MSRRVLSLDEVTDQPVDWPIVSHRVLGRGAVSDFVDDGVATPDGVTMQRQYLRHPGAVAVIALDEADRVVVVRQYRHPVGFRLTEPPAGLLDPGDGSALLAAQRELAEEALLAADDWRVLIDLFTSPGCNQEAIRFFLARGLREVPRPDGFEVEHEELDMEVCAVSVDDLAAAVFAGRVQSPTMVAGILALVAARSTGRLDDLRPAESPWPARAAHAAREQALANFHD